MAGGGATEPDAAAIEQQLAFLLEADLLKGVERVNKIRGGARRENTAEHSWHLVLSAIVLQQHSPAPVDMLKVLTMLAVHDLVEIDAGDTFAYDEAGHETKVAREQAAADRLFGVLPAEQGARLRAVWDEFEASATAEARFAVAIDRLQPVLLNHANRGGGWREHGIGKNRVLAKNAPIADGAPALWASVVQRIEELDGLGLFAE
jgi:putative hydrolases of HD superfamily